MNQRIPSSHTAKPQTIAILVICAICVPGCWASTGNEVFVYTALDQEFSEPIFRDFEEETGIQVLAKYDTESQKTVGLANAILSESKQPRCDLFWNNEILNTLRLDRNQLLRAYKPANVEDFPAQFRSSQQTWHGFAARARVLIVNTNWLAESEYPKSIHDLVDPKWKNEVGIAKPLFGTTATHFAVLFAKWGDEKAKDFLQRLRDNAQVVSGNKQVALAVAGGQLAFGLTDTDDAIIELENGKPVAIVYPDQGNNELGTLFIPNTLGLIANSPNQANAEKLVEYLLSPAVEEKLAQGRSAQIPLNRNVSLELRVETPRSVKAMEVDFGEAADKWEVAATFLRDHFATVR